LLFLIIFQLFLVQWRDHWMQAIYYIHGRPTITNNGIYTIHANHDEHCLWFDVRDCDDKMCVLFYNVSYFLTTFRSTSSPPPICTCYMHTLNSRTNIYRYNDEYTRDVLRNVVQQVCYSCSFCC
jgi:hypothetical protein